MPTSAGTCPTSSATSPITRSWRALTADDFDLNRIQLKEPGPIPEHEARWAWEWMSSWGVLEGRFDVGAQINRRVEREAHAHATVSAG